MFPLYLSRTGGNLPSKVSRVVPLLPRTTWFGRRLECSWNNQCFPSDLRLLLFSYWINISFPFPFTYKFLIINIFFTINVGKSRDDQFKLSWVEDADNVLRYQLVESVQETLNLCYMIFDSYNNMIFLLISIFYT